MTELEKFLAPYGIVRVHRAFLVNLDHVQEVHPFFAGTFLLRVDDLQVERHERIVVGVNDFQSTEPEPEPELLVVNPSVREQQSQRLRDLRQRRDNRRCSELVEHPEQAARGEENVMPLLVQAVEAYCTVGEISDAFRRVWGEAGHFTSI